MRIQIISLLAGIALCLTPNLGHADVVFQADFNGDTAGTGQAIVSSGLVGPAVGSWNSSSTGAGFNNHDDMGEIIGDGAGNNVLLIDGGLDTHGAGNDQLANNGFSSILRGNFAQAFNVNDGANELNFSFTINGSRSTGGTTTNQRQLRVALNGNNGSTTSDPSRAIVFFMDLHSNNVGDMGYVDSADALHDVYLDPGAGGAPQFNTNRGETSYNPANHAQVNIRIDRFGTVFMGVEGNAEQAIEFKNSGITSLDGFDVFFGGSQGANSARGGYFDDFQASINAVPEPGSLAVLSSSGLLVLLRRRRS